jgi:hypothetical protein
MKHGSVHRAAALALVAMLVGCGGTPVTTQPAPESPPLQEKSGGVHLTSYRVGAVGSQRTASARYSTPQGELNAYRTDSVSDTTIHKVVTYYIGSTKIGELVADFSRDANGRWTGTGTATFQGRVTPLGALTYVPPEGIDVAKVNAQYGEAHPFTASQQRTSQAIGDCIRNCTLIIFVPGFEEFYIPCLVACYAFNSTN